jgi:single-strand DNA-binding protein
MTEITVVGNLGGDPELRFTPSGAAVCNFNLADQQRRKNPQTDQWEDGDTTWYRVNVWRQMAENVAESLSKGDRVIVKGRVTLREWTGTDGSTGKTLEITADLVGPDLKWATATVNRVARQDAPDNYGNQGQQGGQYERQNRPQGGRQAPQDDLWGSAPGYGQGGGGGRNQGFQDKPPFHNNTPAFIA